VARASQTVQGRSRILPPVSVDRVNTLNIGLALASCVAAFVVPFELFLFSYIVLGPLHYLTEISWLHKRTYFTRAGSRFDASLLVALAVTVCVAGYLPGVGDAWAPSLAFLAFGSALAMVLLKTTQSKCIAVLGLAALVPLVGRWQHFGVFFGGFLPTIIHVCVFTAAFVLVGALRSGGRSGSALLAVFAACIATIFLAVPEGTNAVVSDAVQTNYSENFYGLNISLSYFFFERPLADEAAVFGSAQGLIIARLIAFSYTYHYLNWFSKTSVIRWHDVPRGWLISCLALWLASLGLYAYDIRAGLATLAFLSLVHVYLEFPLNHQTFLTLGQQLPRLIGRRVGQRM
jgi:hypothetical protein